MTPQLRPLYVVTITCTRCGEMFFAKDANLLAKPGKLFPIPINNEVPIAHTCQPRKVRNSSPPVDLEYHFFRASPRLAAHLWEHGPRPTSSVERKAATLLRESALAEYRAAETELKDRRKATGGAYSDEEDAIIAKMVVAWDKLGKRQRHQLDVEGPQAANIRENTQKP